MQDLIIKLKLLDELTAPLRNALSTTQQFTGSVRTMTAGVNTAQASLKKLGHFQKLKSELAQTGQKLT